MYRIFAILNSREILDLYKNDERIGAIIGSLGSRSNARVHVKGLIGSLDALVAVSVYALDHRNQVFILPDYEEASYFLNDLENLFNKNAFLFPSSYNKPFDILSPDQSNILLRAEALNAIKEDGSYGKLIVTYPEAFSERVIDKKTLEKNTLELKTGDTVQIDFLIDFLVEFGFERVDFVYEAGQFSIRGGIIDIFSFSNDLPYRIELAGDEVESIRTFEPADQLSVKHVNQITLVSNVQTQLLHANPVSLIEFLPADTRFWFKDVRFSLDVVEEGLKKAAELYSKLDTKDKAEHPEWLDPGFAYTGLKELKTLLQPCKVIEFGKQFLYEPDSEIYFDARPQPSFNKDFTLLSHNMRQNEQRDIHNYIFADTAKQVERLYAIFEDQAKQPGQAKSPIPFTPIHLSIREGFIDQKLKIACYTDHQIFDRYYKYKQRKQYSRNQALTLKDLRELKPGDYITHIDHGIGKYAGLEKIEVNGRIQEAIRLVYQDNDLLYVNINSLNRISKFTGKEGTPPRMSKLGSDAWEKLKRNTKKKVKDIARDLIRLYASRKSQKGNAFSPDTYLQTELEASFMYEDTPDQLKATADIKKDMEAPHPMDRLVCGDVGFGKTEVAIRAAFKSVSDSKQVAVLVPTTILALQHYKTFQSRLKDFPCKVDYVSRFKSSREVKETLKSVEEGKTDILIGTHRLVSKDVIFKDLGLLIIDEEQKFGVTTKEKLKTMRVNVDTLTLTATPIPRTLHFSLMGARDLSIINTPPPNRQPIVTELHVFNEQLIREAIAFEIGRGGQIFFIHNRVQDIYEIAGLLKRVCPEAKICVGHGQLEGDVLEDTMMAFVDGEYDVLVATTIIESGLDISNANTIFINHAHMFGLSDLHQMRGRVGRSNKKAYCYLLSPPLSTLTPEARKRLSAIEEFSDLGSGFNVAMRDLDIRGAGNLLGGEQSGFIAEIGFEMYHKILDEAIQELKEEEFKDLFKDQPPLPYVSYCQIDTDLELLIPDEYIHNISERLSLYTELSKIETEEGLALFRKQLLDRFGPVPPQVDELIEAMKLQWLAKELGFEKLSLKKNTLRGSFVANQRSDFYESPVFYRILQYVQQNPRGCRMKEGTSSLILTFENISSVPQAINILKAI